MAPASEGLRKSRWALVGSEGSLLALRQMAVTATRRKVKHDPRLLPRSDGRFEVRCLQCQRNGDLTALPVGIGIPITNRDEAEAIVRNHSGRTAWG